MRKVTKTKISLGKPVSIIAALLALGFCVFVIIEMVTTGSEISILESQELVLKEENRTLSEELIKSSSLNSLEKSAEDLGYKKPDKILYLTLDEGVAAKIR